MTSAPEGSVLGIPVAPAVQYHARLGVNRVALCLLGFDGRVGQAIALSRASQPTPIAVGVGEPAKLDAAGPLDAAAASARAAGRHARLATDLADIGGSPPEAAGQAVVAGHAVVEGVLLAPCTYTSSRASLHRRRRSS